MTESNKHFELPELWDLLELLCEDRLTPETQQRLEEIVVAHADARRIYVEYVTLHGSLYWDAAISPGEFDDESGTAHPARISTTENTPRTNSGPTSAGGRKRWVTSTILTLTACLLVSLGVSAERLFFADDSSNAPIVTVKTPADPGTNPGVTKTTERRKSALANQNKIAKLPASPLDNVVPKIREIDQPPAIARKPQRPPFVVAVGGSEVNVVVAAIDHQLQVRWEEEGVRPSSRAADGEWLRRVTLDIIGRIPTAEEAENFLASDDPGKRRETIDRLLDDPKYVRNASTRWSNLLVGRRPSPDVDKVALEKFLRDSFSVNRSWKEIVIDLVSAEGDGSENGAANFLIAHLNNQAVPATAITARLFLGTQVQCTQCHNHPFNNWKQSQFWELNGFFQQTAKVRKPARTRKGKPRIELVNRRKGGPIYYPQRNELLMAAYPRFAGRQIDNSADVNRRAELARLMFEGEQTFVARAMVNRTWAHFFGHGFTRRVDDMGPHSPPSHPELLDRLTAEFVQSGYDVKRLIRCICNSRAYQLTSRFNETNGDDNPPAGLLPLFSRMYVKSMTAEQLYDSLLIATRAHFVGAGNWDQVEQQRRKWLQQFVIAFDTDENDEATTFDGSIPQALLLMNSPLVQDAVSGKPGTYFHSVLTATGSAKSKVRDLCLAALSREPTEREAAVFHRALSRKVPRGVDRQRLTFETLQDIFWAFLNSNEFILVH